MKQYTFYTPLHALHIARGILPSESLEQWYQSWQYLSDNDCPLCESDKLYLDKLICDGCVLTDDNREELQGRPYRGAHAVGIVSNSPEVS